MAGLLLLIAALGFLFSLILLVIGVIDLVKPEFNVKGTLALFAFLKLPNKQKDLQSFVRAEGIREVISAILLLALFAFLMSITS